MLRGRTVLSVNNITQEVFVMINKRVSQAARRAALLYRVVLPAALVVVFSWNARADVEYGLAARYTNDLGIDSDPAVVFTESFEESSVDEMLDLWEDVSGSDIMTFSPDVPPESGGAQSLFLSSGGHLYTRLLPGYDHLYIRFYTKFDPSCSTIHHFMHTGGYNPSTRWPQGGAGERPAGDERWTTGIEPHGESWAWDFYAYWMHMRTNPGGRFWGNSFSGRPSPFTITRGEWICVEVMVKMNDPVESYNGEQAFWINGEKKNHLGEGFPRGEWIWDGFYPDPSCEPSGPCDPLGSGTPCCQDFEGFQWRSTQDLNINFLWLLHYVDADPDCEVWFDDVVVAGEYIGPMVGDVVPDLPVETVEETEPPPDAAPDTAPDAATDYAGPDITPSDGYDATDAGEDEETGETGDGGCGCSIIR